MACRLSNREVHVPPTIGELMTSIAEVSLSLCKIVQVTKNLRHWTDKSMKGSRGELQQMIAVVLKELFTVSSMMGFLLATVVHEKMKENRAKYISDLFKLEREHYEANPNETAEDASTSRKRRFPPEGMRVMEKYHIHGFHLAIPRDTAFSQDISHWDLRYKQLNFRSLVRADFVYKLEHLRAEIAGFARERGWLGTYTPKKISVSLIAEMGELAETVEWRREEDTVISLPRKVKVNIARETADVTIYLLHLLRELEMRTSELTTHL